MVLHANDKVIVVHRRLLPEDSVRFFVGSVDAYDSGIARVTGFTWTRDRYSGTLQKKEDLRTKIFAIASGSLIVYRLAPETNIDLMKCEKRSDGMVYLTDGIGFDLDITESHPQGSHAVPTAHQKTATIR